MVAFPKNLGSFRTWGQELRNFFGLNFDLTTGDMLRLSKESIRGGIVNVKEFGAEGDGVTDDTTALAAALVAAYGKALYFPSGTYLTTSELYYDTTNGPITIFGVGANSIIKTMGATNRAFHITGMIGGVAGLSSIKLIIKDLKILSGNSGSPSSAIFLDGIALFWIHDIVIDGNSKFTKGFELYGAQQGEISGGYITGVTTGIELTRAGSVGSNGVEIHGMSLNANVSGTNILIDNVDSGFIHHNHMTTAIIGVDAKDSANGTKIESNHIEANGGSPFTAGIQIRGTNATGNIARNNSIIGPGTSLWIKNGVDHIIDGNQFSAGNVIFDSGTSGLKFINNVAVSSIATTFTDNSTSITQFGNRSEGSGFDASTVKFYKQLDIAEISAGSPNLKITKTNHTPNTTWTGGTPSNNPSGFIEITEGGGSKYIPFWT